LQAVVLPLVLFLPFGKAHAIEERLILGTFALFFSYQAYQVLLALKNALFSNPRVMDCLVESFFSD